VVCEADERKLPQLQIILRELEISAFRAFCFSTRSIAPTAHPRDARDPAAGVADSAVLRQIPIWNGDLIAGFVDLALERAFVYREHKASEVWRCKAAISTARRKALLDAGKAGRPRRALMEQLLEDIARRAMRCSTISPANCARPDLPGVARIGGTRERRAASDEGAAA